MKLKYDLHIHTALSPCGAEDMTPNNIVNMALLSDLDIIAITDHNSCENVEAVIEVAKGTTLLVIPGIEIETKEEIHVVCLFSDMDSVCNVQDMVYMHLPELKNKPTIFGRQLVLNNADTVIRQEEKLLSFATDLSINQLVAIVEAHNGVMIPAHIDRPSNSIISNLGMIPDDIQLGTLEISRHQSLEAYQHVYSNYRLIQNSDAHDLGFIGICNQTIELPEKTTIALIRALKTS
ncbi:MAG: PHP domain-containing protein [Vallitaleaceae bacterium]|jgi:PHP family Zn ribbon phosphoesterase|nr:PHP domain-containing protein [Vallitaleaceae bacterium]